MSTTRQRKLLTNENGDTVPDHYTKTRLLSTPQRSRKMQKIFLALICFAVLSLGIYSYYGTLPWRRSKGIFSYAASLVDKIMYSLGMTKYVYAVIIDAGSTGSRVLAFTFYESHLDKNLKLDSELFVEVKPGLSSFADNPKKGAESLQTLLDRAKGVIPATEWGHTPLAMKATAGLRLLPQHKSDALLDEVRYLFEQSPFLTNKNSVTIMDGVDEGIFSWFTVNFLLDRFGGDIHDTVAALDLGGGSTQITFAPSQKATFKSTDKKYFHQISAFQQNLTIYTHSYLGLGLMAARKGILQNGNPKNATTLKSECVNPIIHEDWSYGGVKYKVKGHEKPGSPTVSFRDCVKIATNYVLHINKPEELKHKEINAFSYYFDRATEVGLIDPFTGGKVTVEEFVSAANAACDDSTNTEQPFMCLDLTFISVLLRDGFGLGPKTTLNLYKHIDSHEVSWALGAAFDILQNGI